MPHVYCFMVREVKGRWKLTAGFQKVLLCSHFLVVLIWK